MSTTHTHTHTKMARNVKVFVFKNCKARTCRELIGLIWERTTFGELDSIFSGWTHGGPMAGNLPLDSPSPPCARHRHRPLGVLTALVHASITPKSQVSALAFPCLKSFSVCHALPCPWARPESPFYNSPANEQLGLPDELASSGRASLRCVWMYACLLFLSSLLKWTLLLKKNHK